jgi:hypothetical protein
MICCSSRENCGCSGAVRTGRAGTTRDTVEPSLVIVLKFAPDGRVF